VPFCRIERAISSKRVAFRTDEVMALDDAFLGSTPSPASSRHDTPMISRRFRAQ
jgi:hypothetical protein